MLDTMLDEKEYLSREKHDELVKELDYLRNEARREILSELEDAKKLGDLLENAEYHEARKKQADLEERIATIEALLKNAAIISHRAGDTVVMGSKVTIRRSGMKEEKTYGIVGTEEADSANAKLSNESPLGSMLMGKKKGDRVSVSTPANGLVEYEVMEVK